MFNILCLDGGGARGYFIAYMLKQIEKKYNIKINEYFDLIVGTSTGSIIAAALAVGISLDEIQDIYITENKNIFVNNNKYMLSKLFSSMYDNTYLKNLIYNKFSSNKDSFKTNLMICSTNISSSSPHIYKSWLNNDISLTDAIISSSSAPMYFDPHNIKGLKYSDGAIWANNPTLVALSEAMDKNSFNKKKSQIKILSIGTGLVDKIDDYLHINNWGGTTWLPIITEIVMQTNIKAVDEMAKKILDENYLRINFTSDKKLELITVPDIIMKNKKKIFEQNTKNLDKFFNKKISLIQKIKKLLIGE